MYSSLRRRADPKFDSPNDYCNANCPFPSPDKWSSPTPGEAQCTAFGLELAKQFGASIAPWLSPPHRIVADVVPRCKATKDSMKEGLGGNVIDENTTRYIDPVAHVDECKGPAVE